MRRILTTVPRKVNSSSFNQGLARPFVTLTGNSISPVNKCGNSDQKRHGTSMKVILLENVSNRGVKGEVVAVKRGYARNMLIPRKMAAYATPENKIKHEELITHRKELVEAGIVEAADLITSNKFEPPPLKNVVEAQVIAFVRGTFPGQKGVLLTAVTVEDVRLFLREGGFVVPSASTINMAHITYTGFFPLIIDGVNCILQVIEEVGAKEEPEEKKIGKKKLAAIAAEEEKTKKEKEEKEAADE